MIEVKIDDAEIVKALQDFQRAVGDLSPALKDIGAMLVESTQQRFNTSTGPDGQSWEPNSQTTYEAMLHRRSGDYQDGKRVGNKKGAFRKDGRVSAKSAGMLSGKKPLVEHGTLMQQIHAQVNGNVLEVGSSMEYAAMQQFGGTKAEFSHLWGDIPARPFLGISEADAAEILDIVHDHLANP